MSYSCFQKVIHVGWCECDKHGLIFQQHIDILLHLIQYLIYRPSNYDYIPDNVTQNALTLSFQMRRYFNIFISLYVAFTFVPQTY